MAAAAATGYQAAAGSARHLASMAAAIPANSAATPSCGSNPSAASPARPTSTQETIPRTRPAGKATNATTRTAWCSDRAPTRNEPASHAGPTAAIKARSGSGPLAATPAATKASPTATSMAVSQGLAAGASLSARTAIATSTPMKTTPLADIATKRADRFGLAALILGSSQRRHLSARFPPTARTTLPSTDAGLLISVEYGLLRDVRRRAREENA